MLNPSCTQRQHSCAPAGLLFVRSQPQAQGLRFVAAVRLHCILVSWALSARVYNLLVTNSIALHCGLGLHVLESHFLEHPWPWLQASACCGCTFAFQCVLSFCIRDHNWLPKSTSVLHKAWHDYVLGFAISFCQRSSVILDP